MNDTVYFNTKISKQYLLNIGFDRRLLILFFSGIGLGLSEPGFNQSYLAWFSLVPLFIILRSCINQIQAILAGFIFGFGYYLIAISYFLNLNNTQTVSFESLRILLQNVLTWWIYSAVYSTVFIIFALILYLLPLRTSFIPWFKRPYYPFLLTAPFLWIYLNYSPLSILFYLKNLTVHLSSSQYLFVPLIQIAKIGGSQLIDFFIILVNASLSNLIIQNFPLAKLFSPRIDNLKDGFGCLLDNAIILLILFTLYTWGELQINEDSLKSRLTIKDEPSVYTIVICNRLIGENTLNTSQKIELIETYKNLLKKHPGWQYFVCPEGQYALGDQNSLSNQTLAKNLTFSHNSSISNNLLTYQVNSHSASLKPSPWGKIGIISNFALRNPYLAKNLTRNGASLLITSNEIVIPASSSLNDQLLAISVFTAIENNRYVILASNTGIIAIVEPNGLIANLSRGNKANFILNRVKFLYKQTFYTRAWWL